MFDRLRRAFGARETSQGGPAATTRAAPPRPTGPDPLPEGVYTHPGGGQIVHYVAAGQPRPLCGRPADRLWRCSSAWYPFDQDRRCKRCDWLVGERGYEAHGVPTDMDMLIFGIEPPLSMPEAERISYRTQYEQLRARNEAIALEAAASAAPPGTTFSDPPYVYDKDPARPRTSDESTYDHVINDVYMKTRTGKKWHRVYETHKPSTDPRLAWSGRGLLFPCGNVGDDFERDDNGQIYAPPIRTDIPPAVEICRGCARSDAKYGKGVIPNTARWDR